MTPEPFKKPFSSESISRYVGNPSSKNKTSILPPEETDQNTVKLRQIAVWPVMRASSVIFSIIGLIVGFFAFLASPTTGEFGELTFTTRFLSAIVFALLYMLIITFGITLVVLIYNFLASKFRWGLKLQLTKQNQKD